MERRISGFHQDAAGDWVAELDCGHGQHVRHKPPFFNRPWVISAAGRAARLGAVLDCVRCDRLEWPESLRYYKRTPAFTQATLPPGLLNRHTTRNGTWARVVLAGGSIDYRIDEPLHRSFHLTPATPGIVPPTVPHALVPIGPVELHVEFYRRAG